MNHFLLDRVMFAMTGADFRHCCPLSMTEQHCCLPIYVFYWVERGSCCCCMTQSFAYTKIHKYINQTEILGKFRLHCVQFEGISEPVLNPQKAPCLASGLGSVHTHEKESFLPLDVKLLSSEDSRGRVLRNFTAGFPLHA